MKGRYNAHLREAPYPSGKGAVCKTAMQRFEPARRLQFLFRLFPFVSPHTEDILGKHVKID